jgi:flagellar biogenesis protein FliO
MRARVRLGRSLLVAAALSLVPATRGVAGPNAPDDVPGSGETPQAAPARTASAERGQTAMNPIRIEGGVVLRLMLGAVGLCVLGGCLVYAARRWGPGGASSPGAAGLQVLGRVALSPRHFVCVLGAGGKKIVVGVSGDHMTALAVLGDPQAPRATTLGRAAGTVRVEGALRADGGPGGGRTEPSQRSLTEADLLPYRRQVTRIREMFRGRVDDLSAGIDAP